MNLQIANRYRSEGRLAEAEKVYVQLIQANPNDEQALYAFALLKQQQNRLNEAVTLYQKVIAVNPKHVFSHYKLGLLLHAAGHFETAEQFLRRTIALNPNYFEAHTHLGYLLSDIGRVDDAIQSIHNGLALRPDSPELYGTLGRLYGDKGNIVEAIASLRKAIELKPDLVRAHYEIAVLTQQDHYSQDMQAMEELYQQQSTAEKYRKYLCFGLAKGFEELKEYDKAFAYMDEGNRLHRSSYQYSIEQDRDAFQRIKETFTAEFFNAHKNAAIEDSSPIFIVGMPRSSTSLTEQILASHPEVFGAGELLYMPTLCSNLPGADTNTFPEGLDQASDALLQELGHNYCQQLKNQASGENRITDKLPHNFLYIGIIATVFPKAKIIHCQRDPMDNCLAQYKKFFGEGLHYAYQLDELAEYHRLYQSLMDHWHAVLPGRVYDISYERLVEDTDSETRKLLDHCQLPFDPACLDFHKTKREIKTSSRNQARQPIYKSAVSHWKNYQTHLKPLEKILNPEHH